MSKINTAGSSLSVKRLLVLCLVIAAAVASNLFFFNIQPDGNKQVAFCLYVSAGVEQNYQVYYNSEKPEWSEERSVLAPYNNVGEVTAVSFSLPNDTKYLRVDLGIVPQVTHTISRMSLTCERSTIDIPAGQITDPMGESGLGKHQVVHGDTEGHGEVQVTTASDDGYFVLDLSEYDLRTFAMEAQKGPLLAANIVRCVAVDLFLLCVFLFARRLAALPMDLYHNRELILNLAKNDFKTRYAGSYLGIFWAFVQPVVTIAVYSFVFQVGFRSGAVMDCPFVLWLIAGMVPWFFFSDALNGGTSSLLEYSYLVKKVVFKISILPVVKVISAMFVHLIFMAITVILFALFGFFPNLYTLQMLYYTFCLFVFVLGLDYITCSLVVFFRDLGQIIGIFLQVGVWLTPIMWQETMMPEKYRWILKINPLYYIVRGYREALIEKVWFWQNINQTIYFWCVTAAVFALGCVVFKRLKVHFADVL